MHNFDPDNINRGNRVRYIGTLMPAFTGQEGTVATETKKGYNVRFDFQPDTLTECFEVNLLKLRRPRKDVVARDLKAKQDKLFDRMPDDDDSEPIWL